MRNRLFEYVKTKTQISFTVTAKLISAFVFATQIGRGSVRGRFGQNTRPRGRNFALYWCQGEVGVSLKNFFFFFFKFSSCQHTIDKV